MNLVKTLETVSNIEAHFELSPIFDEYEEDYLEGALLIFEFCQEAKDIYYQSLFLFRGLLELDNDVNSKAAACIYYASRFDDNNPINWDDITFPFNISVAKYVRTSIVRNMIGMYRRVTPSDYFRSMLNPSLSTLADEMLSLSYCFYPHYYSMPVGPVAHAYYNLARCMKLKLPYLHLPAYFDYYYIERKGVPPTSTGGIEATSSAKVINRTWPRLGGSFKVVGFLGEGGYGMVTHVTSNGKDLALKSQDDISTVVTELSILSTYLHKNIIKFEGVKSTNKIIDIFLELGTPLTKILGTTKVSHWSRIYLKGLHTKQQLPVDQRRSYQKDCIAGLQYLREVGVIHRDIKAGNVIIVDGVAKLADFGLSLQGILSDNDRQRSQAGMFTVTNRPFELLWYPKKTDYSFAADVWALATLLVEIETSCPISISHTSPEVVRDAVKPEPLSVITEYIMILGLPPLSIYGEINFTGILPTTRLLGVSDLQVRELFLSMLNYNEFLRPRIDKIYSSFVDLM